VSFEGFLEGDFTGSSNFETLFCARVSFYFWHYYNLYDYSLLAVLHRRNTFWAMWEMDGEGTLEL
jgi:hypothetical protein